MARINDVAERAGVSVATVSRALSHPEKVKPETRRRVLEVIEAMEYRPNLLARHLRTQSTKTVIAIAPGLDNAAFREVILGVEEVADDCGYQVLIADVHGKDSIEAYYLNAIRQRQIDGIISMSARMAQRLIRKVADEYPLVMALQSFEDGDIPTVSIDNRAAARAATVHLLHMGHKRVAHITSAQALSVYREREDGYRQALGEAGIAVDEGLIRSTEPTIQGGYAQAQAMLAEGRRFTAVFAAGDMMAIGAIKALRQAGLRVPGDCSVVGFDDIGLATDWEPALTTIRQPLKAIGRSAFEMLLALIEGREPARKREILPYELVVRESCGDLL